MAFDVSFDPAKARHLKECLASGRPIEDISTIDDLLLLAGLCFHRLVSLMPKHFYDQEWLQYSANPERAAFDAMCEEMKATIEYVGHWFTHQRRNAEGTPERTSRYRVLLNAEIVTFTLIDDEHDAFSG